MISKYDKCEKMISIKDFSKLELKIGTVLEAKEVAGSEKLIKLKVDLGEENPRQILAGIKRWYTGEDLVGRQVVVVANLEPRRMMNLESEGMVLAASCDDKPVLLTVSEPVPPGSEIR